MLISNESAVCAGRMGVSKATLLYIEKASILPVLYHEWGLVSHSGNRVMKTLASMYSDMLRIASGALRTSPLPRYTCEVSYPWIIWHAIDWLSHRSWRRSNSCRTPNQYGHFRYESRPSSRSWQVLLLPTVNRSMLAKLKMRNYPPSKGNFLQQAAQLTTNNWERPDLQ